MRVDDTSSADRIARRRARLVQVLAVLFIASQAAWRPTEGPFDRVQVVSLLGWLVWMAGFLLLLASGGGFLRSTRVRALLNDDTTRDHRARALTLGYWIAISMGLVVYAASFPFDIPVREGVRVILTVSIAAAVFRFGALEKKALDEPDGRATDQFPQG